MKPTLGTRFGMLVVTVSDSKDEQITRINKPEGRSDYTKVHRAYESGDCLCYAVLEYLKISEVLKMKKDIHPEYKEVVFQDISTDFAFLTKSTVKAKETIKWTDGKEYPLVKVEVSSHSHPFYTGKQKIVDTAGRVDRFRRKYQLA
jgi:large subunit ribosomal protein L31